MVLADEPSDAGGEGELLERRRLVRNAAEDERKRAALAVAVDAKTGPASRVGDVELTGLDQHIAAAGRGSADVVHDRGQVGFVETRLVDRPQPTVGADPRRPADLEVNVGGAGFDGAREQRVEIHPPSRNRSLLPLT